MGIGAIIGTSIFFIVIFGPVTIGAVCVPLSIINGIIKRYKNVNRIGGQEC